jgi:hypothetical protein
LSQEEDNSLCDYYGRQLAQDWPNLKKYQNENTTLQKQLLAKKSSFYG